MKNPMPSPGFSSIWVRASHSTRSDWCRRAPPIFRIPRVSDFLLGSRSQISDDPAFARAEQVASHVRARRPSAGDEPYIIRPGGPQSPVHPRDRNPALETASKTTCSPSPSSK